MSTITRPPEEDTSPEPSLWIWNPVLWIPSELDLSVNYSDQTTSSSGKPEPETTGPRDTTLKVLNWSTPFWMLSERKPKDVIVYKDSKLPTLWEEVPDPVWELCWSPRSEKSIPIELWKLSPSSHPPRSLIPSLNHITPLCPSINWSKTLMNVWSLITKLCMISVSELWN